MSNLTIEQEEIILKCYIEEKRGQVYCAKQAGTSPKDVKEFLKEKNIHIRNYSESATLSNMNRKLKVQDNYFKKETPNMAWLLGFIASDGTISKDRNGIAIGLAEVDEEILFKIKKELGIEREIKYYTNSKGYSSCKLGWSSQEHKQDLSNYGIVSQKTFNLVFPKRLNRKYWIDYIRGYFDGDGSVNYLKSNKALRWQICGVNKDFLQEIVDFLYEEYNIPKVKVLVQKKVNHNLYYFQYSTNSTKKIYNILYTPNSLYLKRKKEHFDEIIALMK